MQTNEIEVNRTMLTLAAGSFKRVFTVFQHRLDMKTLQHI